MGTSLNSIRIVMTVGNPTDPTKARELEFVVDSGLMFSVVPSKVLSEIGVTPNGVEYVRLADLTRIKRAVGEASFSYRGTTRTSPVMFGEEGDATLLGTMTLRSFGLVLDPYRQELRSINFERLKM